MIWKVWVVSLFGALLCLDRVFIQAMVSRPIVAGPLVGLILNDPYTGLVAGAFIELFWIDQLPIGGHLPPNDTIVSVLVAASAIEASRMLGAMPRGLIAMAVLIAVPMGLAARPMEHWFARVNGTLAKKAVEDACRGDARSISRGHWSAVLRYGLTAWAAILVALPAGIFLLSWGYPRLSPAIKRGLDLVYTILPLIGAAVALNTIHQRGAVPIFCALFLAAAILFGVFRGA